MREREDYKTNWSKKGDLDKSVTKKEKITYKHMFAVFYR